MLKPSATRLTTYVGLWLLLYAVLQALWLWSGLRQQEQDFLNQSRLLAEKIQQRLDQNEAILFSLDALIRTQPEAPLSHIRHYAQSMLARYPHIYTVEYQPQVTLAQRAAFETAQRQVLGPQFVIKDFGFSGGRSWRAAPDRPFYFPIVMMEPNLAAAQSVYGLDVYHDPLLGRGIDAAVRSGKLHTSPPFTLIEGGRGYLFFLPVRLQASYGSTPELGVISLLIRSNKLLPADLPPSLGLALYHQGYAASYGAIAETGAAPASPWLPTFRQERRLGSSQQPFTLRLSQGFAPDKLAASHWLLPPALASLLLLLGLSLRQQFRRRRSAERRALQAWAQAEEEARAAELEKRLRERDAELHHLNRFNTMGEMAAGIAHEIKQPLTAIMSYNEACLMLLQNEATPNAAALRRAMQSSAEQARRAADIIQRLRRFISKQRNPRQTLLLSSLVAEALALMAHELQAQRVSLEQEWPRPESTIEADAVQLTQVLLNLIKNALEAMQSQPHPDGNRLRLAARQLGSQLELCLYDNGPGFEPASAERLFHPFVSSKADGLGLGLSICRSIVEQHGGQLQGWPAPVGGACFCLSLPLSPPGPSL